MRQTDLALDKGNLVFTVIDVACSSNTDVVHGLLETHGMQRVLQGSKVAIALIHLQSHGEKDIEEI